MSLMIDCRNRVAFVSGSSGKLGGTMARMLAEAGADVALHAFSRPERLRPLAAHIAQLGRKSCEIQGNVSDATDVARMRAKVEEALGPVDILVINAVSQLRPWLPVLEETSDRLQDQFNSCSLQTLHLTQAFVPTMCERGWGRVIGISTECIMQLFAKQGAYVCGKRGMDGLLRVLSKEVGPANVTVNQVAPGWIDTGETPDRSAASLAYIEKQSAMGRRATDIDVANTVAFLASDLARSITGCWIPVSCGSVQPRV